MNSIASCYRCLLVLLLPFLIVFSVLYLTSTPLTSTTNSPLSSETSSKETTTTTTTTTTTKLVSKKLTPSTTNKQRKCHPFNVSDTRPFFEREPIQNNLPRLVLKSSRSGLRRQLHSLRLALVACAYNIENDVDKFRKYVEPIIDLFHSSSRIFILESDSTDNTLAKLRQWPRAEVYTYGNLSKTIPRRTERIAYCRNQLLEKARQLQPDYMLVLDSDIFAANISSFLTNFDYDTDDWSVMTANLINNYYDIWALRTLTETILNYDVWHRVWSMGYVNDYCVDSVIKNTITIHQKPFPIERGLLEVRSAFDGAGLYKMEATEGCSYSGEVYTCEHVPFHICMKEKNNAKIFINPRFKNERFT